MIPVLEQSDLSDACTMGLPAARSAFVCRTAGSISRDGGQPMKVGEYVVATKYADGDPGDPFCIGFYNGAYDHCGQTRHLVADARGAEFRANGFRRVARVSVERGAWMVRNLMLIEKLKDRFSVWHWWRAPWRELRAYDGQCDAKANP